MAVLMLVLPRAGAAAPAIVGEPQHAPGKIVLKTADTPPDPNQQCRENPECSEALHKYLDAFGAFTTAHNAYEQKLREVYRNTIKNTDFRPAVSRIKRELEQLGKLPHPWTADQNSIHAFVENMNSAIDAYKEVNDDVLDLLFQAYVTSLPVDLSMDNLLAEELRKAQAIVSAINELRDKMRGLPLAALKPFMDNAQGADLQRLKVERAAAEAKLEDARKRACAFGAVVGENDPQKCPKGETSTSSARLPIIEIIRADYGDLWAGRNELKRDAVRQVREHTCNATPYIRARCQYAPYAIEFCTVKTTTSDGGVKIEVKQPCPSTCELDKGCEKHPISGMSQVSRADPVCIVNVTHRDLCGGFNPAPSSDRSLFVQYQCNVDGKPEDGAKVLGREGEKVYLECPTKRVADAPPK